MWRATTTAPMQRARYVVQRIACAACLVAAAVAANVVLGVLLAGPALAQVPDPGSKKLLEGQIAKLEAGQDIN